MDVQEELIIPIHKLLKKNRDIFATNDKDLGTTDTVKMRKTDVKKTYHTPLRQRNLVDEFLELMLEAKIIKISRGPWKKHSSKSFCVDFRALMKITK